MTKAHISLFSDGSAIIDHQGTVTRLAGYATVEACEAAAVATAKKIVHPVPIARPLLAAGTAAAVAVTGTWLLKPPVHVIDTVTVMRESTLKSQRLAGANLFTCLTGENNEGVVCQGINDKGQLGIDKTGANKNKVTPLARKQVTAIAVDRDTVCAATEKQVWCWGENETGQVNPEKPGATATPRIVWEAEDKVSTIMLGAKHVCAATGKQVWCWGGNQSGQISRSKDAVISPARIDTPQVLKQVAYLESSGYVTTVEDVEGTIVVFGSGGTQELEPGSSPGFIAPKVVSRK